jgi:hypothetical protein
MISDMKWEGDEWMTPGELARASKSAPAAKRRRVSTKTTQDSDEEEDCLTDNEVSDNEYEQEDENEDEGNEDKPYRKRDKDRIPSKFVTVQTGPDTWELQPRPICFSNGMFFSYKNIPPKQKDLLQLMLDDKLNPIDESFLREHLVKRLNRTHPVSLRLVDWLVVDYACAKNVKYKKYIPSLKREVIVVVHKAYTSWLDRWRRRHYDPFRRRRRILFNLDGSTYSTTVAQLHFFYMANIYGFLEYATLKRDKILAHMTATTAASNAAKAAAKAEGLQAPRRPLVTKAKSEAYVSAGNFVMSFQLDGDVEEDDENQEAIVDPLFPSHHDNAGASDVSMAS